MRRRADERGWNGEPTEREAQGTGDYQLDRSGGRRRHGEAVPGGCGFGQREHGDADGRHQGCAEHRGEALGANVRCRTASSSTRAFRS